MLRAQNSRSSIMFMSLPFFLILSIASSKFERNLWEFWFFYQNPRSFDSKSSLFFFFSLDETFCPNIDSSYSSSSELSSASSSRRLGSIKRGFGMCSNRRSCSSSNSRSFSFCSSFRDLIRLGISIFDLIMALP